MTTYSITVRQHERTIGIGFLFCVAILLIAGFVLPMVNSFTWWTLVAIVTITTHFSFRKFSMAKTEWKLDEQSITIKWLTQYYGNTSSDLYIKWDEIKKYKDVLGRGYDLFKIYLVDGNIIEFGHGGLFVIDDFNKFYEQFQEMHQKNKHPELWAKYYKKKLQ